MNAMKNTIIQSFIDGIAYFFGVGENPIEEYYRETVRKRKERNKGLQGWEIDARNLRGDWERVGMHLKNAMNQYEQETTDANK
jgi:hypothetical protein